MTCNDKVETFKIAERWVSMNYPNASQEEKERLATVFIGGMAEMQRQIKKSNDSKSMNTKTDMKYKVGDKIKFSEERYPYTIRACNSRFLICTKPFNLKHTVLYTIVDLKDGIRGTNWWVFNIYEYIDDADCKQCLRDLVSGKCKISHRNRIKLNIES